MHLMATAGFNPGAMVVMHMAFDDFLRAVSWVPVREQQTARAPNSEPGGMVISARLHGRRRCGLLPYGMHSVLCLRLFPFYAL